MRKSFILLFSLSVFFNRSSVSLAQSDLGFRGVGGKIGIVDPEGLDATVGIGGFWRSGRILSDLNFEINLDYWFKSVVDFGFGGFSGGGGVEANLRDLTLGGTLKYIFPTKNAKLSPFLGGGSGLHILHSKVKVPGFELPEYEFPGIDESDTKIKIGLRLVGGLIFNLAPQIDGFAEFRYWIVEDFNTVAVLAGVVFKTR